MVKAWENLWMFNMQQVHAPGKNFGVRKAEPEKLSDLCTKVDATFANISFDFQRNPSGLARNCKLQFS